MRILLAAALLGSGLCARTPPVKPLEPAATPVLRLPPTWIAVTPDGTVQLVLPGIVARGFGRATPAPGGTCSIPLTRVVPKGGFTSDPRIVLPEARRPGTIDHMPVIQGSPPCPPVQR